MGEGKGFPCSWGLCELTWCVRTLGHFDQIVSPSSVSEGILFPFPPSQLSPQYQGLAKRRDTCPVYKLADLAREGLNKTTVFLAHSSGERKPPCVLVILCPQICGLRGKEHSLEGRSFLFPPHIPWGHSRWLFRITDNFLSLHFSKSLPGMWRCNCVLPLHDDF